MEKGENMKQKKEKIEIISEPADITDIYFSTSKRFYKSRRLRIRYSNIYNFNEYYWHGMLRKNAQLCIKRKDGTTFPKFLNYGYGITLEGFAKDMFKVENAKTIVDNDRSYNYINDQTTLIYVGKAKKYTFCIRVYGEEQNSNDRWVVISIGE